MDSVAIKDELKKYTNLYPYIKKNYQDYYVMSKTGTDDNGGLSRAKVAWQRLSGKVLNLEAIVKDKINLNLEFLQYHTLFLLNAARPQRRREAASVDISGIRRRHVTMRSILREARHALAVRVPL